MGRGKKKAKNIEKEKKKAKKKEKKRKIENRRKIQGFSGKGDCDISQLCYEQHHITPRLSLHVLDVDEPTLSQTNE